MTSKADPDKPFSEVQIDSIGLEIGLDENTIHGVVKYLVGEGLVREITQEEGLSSALHLAQEQSRYCYYT
jgi:hypothetical protein